MMTSLYCETRLATVCHLNLKPIKCHYVQYIQCGCWSQSSTFRGLLLDVLGGTWSTSSFTGGQSATLSLLGGCAVPGRKSCMFHCLLIGWCWTFKLSFKSQELSLSGVFIVTFLWTAAGGTIGHFRSSSYLSGECIALGRGVGLEFSRSGSSIWAC